MGGDWSSPIAKQILETFEYKILPTPNGRKYDFEASDGRRIYAVEAKGTDSEAPFGKLVLSWTQIVSLTKALEEGKVPLLMFINEKYDYAIFTMTEGLLNLRDIEGKYAQPLPKGQD